MTNNVRLHLQCKLTMIFFYNRPTIVRPQRERQLHYTVHMTSEIRHWRSKDDSVHD